MALRPVHFTLRGARFITIASINCLRQWQHYEATGITQSSGQAMKGSPFPGLGPGFEQRDHHAIAMSELDASDPFHLVSRRFGLVVALPLVCRLP